MLNKQKFHANLIMRALAPLMLAVFPIASFADDDDGATVYFEEVIVTAERTERSVLDTAMTITGFGEDALKRFGIQDRDKLQILVPGLQFGETVDMLGTVPLYEASARVLRV